ncbi:MAG TPA: UDP-3-O-(3-hydroxymyristoyl)glucosamine N-acyltransferase [Gemmatimonadaceae bacterium]|nr:UDP-3-O-(3-hydroxymyristoyl)glucosamine N-acyltransferase [Gemmatimonadaceae bacterium]
MSDNQSLHPRGKGEVSGGEGGNSLTAAAIAELVGGTVVGDASVRVRAAAPLDRARGDELSFLGSGKYVPLFSRSQAGVVLLSRELADSPGGVRARIVVGEPYEAMLRVLPSLYPEAPDNAGVHSTAVLGRGIRLGRDVAVGPYAILDEGATLGDGARIGAHCYVGRAVTVGARSELLPNVTLYAGTTLGERVRIHSGARIGSDGFGYVFHQGEHRKIPHVGRCIIENDVEIGANTTIDRGSIDDTVIGAGTKIDNLVHVAHNVRIGKLCLLMAQVGLSGSAHVGDGVILAGQAGIAGHVTIGDHTRIAAQAGVFGDVPADETWSGYPARPHRQALRAQAALFKMPSLLKRLEKLLGDEET